MVGTGFGDGFRLAGGRDAEMLLAALLELVRVGFQHFSNEALVELGVV